MSLWKEYIHPRNVQEAVEALASAPEPVCAIAGGTDLMLDLQQGNHPPVHTMVDLTCIPELRLLEVRGDELVIGAGVPHNQIVDSPLVQEHAQALVEACGLIGGPQVRNMATLGGNVAHALPAADGTIGLMSLNARVEIASPAGRRRPSHSVQPSRVRAGTTSSSRVGAASLQRQNAQCSAARTASTRAARASWRAVMGGAF